MKQCPVSIDLSRVKAILFDMDGLMFNTEDVYRAAIIKMGERRGKVFTDEIHRSMMGRAAIEDVTVLLNAWGLQEDPNAVFEERKRLFLELIDSMIRPEPGLQALLEASTQAGLRLAVVTGSIKEIAVRNLQKFGMERTFEFMITGEQVVNGKPNPEIYQKAIALLKVRPDECLVIEDSVNGVRSGKAAGCIAFAVPNPYNQNDDFSMADGRFQTLAEIANLIRPINPS